MKTNTKNNIKLFFKSWINNASCVEGGRHKPWYAASLILFFSTLIAVIPTFVKAITTQGDAIISNQSYGIEVASERFIETINEKQVTMKISAKDDGSHILDVDAGVWNAAFETTKDIINSKYAVFQHKNELDKVDMEFFYVNNFTDEFLQDINYEVKVDEEGREEKIGRRTSYLAFSKESYVLYLANPVTQQGVSSVPGDYKSFEIGYKINQLNGVGSNPDFGKTKADTLNPALTPNYGEFLDEAWSAWRSFYVKGYDSTRLTVTWQTTLISTGINVVLTLFFGLMVFVITRGKNNPFRVYTIWESQKIAWWATLSPAILACGLGFLFANFSQVVFPLLMGVRVMWLSMRTLRPDNIPSK